MPNAPASPLGTACPQASSQSRRVCDLDSASRLFVVAACLTSNDATGRLRANSSSSIACRSWEYIALAKATSVFVPGAAVAGAGDPLANSALPVVTLSGCAQPTTLSRTRTRRNRRTTSSTPSKAGDARRWVARQAPLGNPDRRVVAGPGTRIVTLLRGQPHGVQQERPRATAH